jgi:D-hydroxyproline dehydrogenase subunit beta
MRDEQIDVAVVGAGIVGLAHAYIAAKSGRRVVIFERSPAARGASIRNFGMIWPIGQPPGKLHALALRSREIWIDVLREAGLPFRQTGSLHVTYEPDEAAVAQEFAERAPALGYECAWLPARQTLQKTQAVRPDGLLGSLWSASELTVDPRQVVKMLPEFLTATYGVRCFFNTPVQQIEHNIVTAGGRTWKTGMVIVTPGDDFQTLFPECFQSAGLTRCKLQMMRTAPQPDNWKLGASLAFGPSFLHYPTFQICASLGALKERMTRELSELLRWGIHIMASQTASGEITLGDSHEYGLAVNVFDRPIIDGLILNYAKRYMRLPDFSIRERWHGVYAKHPELPYLRASPEPGVQVVTVTGGIGMTLSFGIAEETFCNC